ncbi:MAG: galactarate dehydratase [Saprospiraceae bacterium]|nr:galactarate dehydratase [Saprospiraceae bacterium]
MATHNILKVAPNDNVGIVTNLNGLKKGSKTEDGILLREDIPMGFKIALEHMEQGKEIIRYGEVIGLAKEPIDKGRLVHFGKMIIPEPPRLESIPLQDRRLSKPEPLKGYFFDGYKNKDGSVGTRNILGISTSVQCVAGLAEHVANKIKAELLDQFSNVDDVVAITHSYGCGVAIDAPAAIIPIRTIRNIANNPNFGGEVMVLGLGCEKLRPERLLTNDQKEDSGSHIMYMQDERFQRFEDMVKGAMEMAKNYLKKLNERKREPCPVSDLVVGMQCGGSDAFSGITGNPVAGFVSDLIVRAGGSVLFSEVTEVRDAIHLLVSRAIDKKVGQALINEMQWYDAYLLQGNSDRSANPTPGNKMGGISNIVEKALGSIAKSGTSPIVDVIPPGEKLRKRGLSFAATPASDFICGTLQVAAGMNMHLFITGRGTPYGLSMVPVVKISSNSKLSRRWHDLIDFDAGPIALGEKTIEEMGWDLFHLILDIASGKKQVACDRLGLCNDLVLFNPGPIT